MHEQLMNQKPHFTEQKTKISITHAGNKFKAILPWDADLETIFDSLFALLNAAGWGQDTIKNEVISWAETYVKEQE
jgi:hypothetical protein